MIKFFRKIRQKILNENKFSKYLLYAIGEIALVVIGILIALSINNWNEVSKINLLEKDLLIEVKNGLEYDLDQLNKAITFQHRSLRSQDIIVDWIEGKTHYNDSLRNQISNLYDLVYQDLNWWQEDYMKIKTSFRNSLTDLGFEVIGSKRLDAEILPYEPLKLKGDKTYIFNLKITRANLDIFTNRIMINGLLEIEKTIEMITKEIDKR